MMQTPRNFLEILKRHSECTGTIAKKASGLEPAAMECSADPEVMRIRKMVNAVLGENHMMKAFVRLKPMGKKVLYGYMRPEHDIWSMTGSFFARRFPGTVIALGNNSVSWTFIFENGTVRNAKGPSLAKTLAELETALGSGPERNPDKLWDAYYWSQYRREAKNTPYFKHNMREKYTRKAGIRAETDSGAAKLEDFG